MCDTEVCRSYSFHDAKITLHTSPKTSCLSFFNGQVYQGYGEPCLEMTTEYSYGAMVQVFHTLYPYIQSNPPTHVWEAKAIKSGLASDGPCEIMLVLYYPLRRNSKQ